MKTKAADREEIFRTYISDKGSLFYDTEINRKINKPNKNGQMSQTSPFPKRIF